ncbi:hypothetical protein EK21DRAFT_64188 [Setomelanomma holmii]|uniref:Uncharacterized protein n=1 Tax=Setomelanomma holmii TaxID=210430 RepID=A0A9P4HAT2_9PLEO|nr:hypothetical protein EK21DRAFT_64188 [Setomelanomma holmii]
MRPIGWVEFKEKYDKKSESAKNEPMQLKALFGWYEMEFQRIIYRRFKYLYSTRWSDHTNPQAFKTQLESLSGEERQHVIDDEERIKKEGEQYPNIGVIIPDHRIRRIQHLLSDLVELLDEVSTMKFNRPVRRCGMEIDNSVLARGNPLGLQVGGRVPCDCHFPDCNPKRQDFEHRQLAVPQGRMGRSKSWQVLQPARQPTTRADNFTLSRHTTEKQTV